MASITKTGDRKYFVRVSSGGGSARQQKTKVIRGTRGDAKKWADLQETAFDLNEIADINLKLIDFLEDWLDKVMSKKLRNATINSYATMINLHIVPRLGKTPLIDLKSFQIQKIITEMESANLSPRTIQYVHSILRGALNYAVKKDLLLTNPALKCDLPKLSRAEKEVLTLDQAKRFIEHSRTVKNGLICEFLLVTGLRPSECLALKWSDFDFANGTVSITRGVTNKRNGDGGYEFHPTKTKKSNRMLPVSNEIITRLREYKRKQNEHILLKGSNHERLDLVFASEAGTPLQQKNFRDRVFNKVLKLANIPSTITPYSIRHTFATLMLMSNENIKVVQEYLGHSSIAVTADTYSHVTPMMKKSASENLQSLLG